MYIDLPTFHKLTAAVCVSILDERILQLCTVWITEKAVRPTDHLLDKCHGFRIRLAHLKDSVLDFFNSFKNCLRFLLMRYRLRLKRLTMLFSQLDPDVVDQLVDRLCVAF